MDIFILSISMGTLIVLFVSYVINKSETKENEKQQQSYSEEEVIKILYQFHYDLVNSNFDSKKEWFEQFKKK